MPETRPYDQIAGEYYLDLHETCRNFDATTAAAFVGRDVIIPDGLVLDVGAGRGRCGEFLGVSPDRVIQLDSSPEMLKVVPRENAIARVLHDAEVLPFPSDEFGLVAAFLCDPYLGLNFLHESFRVLRPGGRLVGTTPAYDWGQALRVRLALDAMMTRFVLQSGEKVHVPSALYQAEQLRCMIEHAGFQRASIDIRLHRLPPGTAPISKDVVSPATDRGVSPFDLDIICSFEAEA